MMAGTRYVHFLSLPLALIRLPILHPFVFCIGFVRIFSRALFQLDGILMAVRLDQRDGSPSPPEQELWPHDSSQCPTQKRSPIFCGQERWNRSTGRRQVTEDILRALSCSATFYWFSIRHGNALVRCHLAQHAGYHGEHQIRVDQKDFTTVLLSRCAVHVLGSLREMPSNSVT